MTDRIMMGKVNKKTSLCGFQLTKWFSENNQKSQKGFSFERGINGAFVVLDSIRFTLVSEPPEEEEQERECEDVGVAYLRIPDILEKQQDLTESRLNGTHARSHARTLFYRW